MWYEVTQFIIFFLLFIFAHSKKEAKQLLLFCSDSWKLRSHTAKHVPTTWPYLFCLGDLMRSHVAYHMTSTFTVIWAEMNNKGPTQLIVCPNFTIYLSAFAGCEYQWPFHKQTILLTLWFIWLRNVKKGVVLQGVAWQVYEWARSWGAMSL